MSVSGQYTFSELLRQFRVREHVTQWELAQQLHVHRNTIGAWERGDYLPEDRTMVSKLADILRLDEEDTDKLQKAAFVIIPPVRQGGIGDASGRQHFPGNLPYRRNPFFTGREEALTRLHETLTSEKKAALTQPQLLSGLGGIGKTQTAVEYAYRYRDEYEHILWARAESPEVLISDFMRLAAHLKLQEKDERDRSRIVDSFTRWLADSTGWLLILDNVENLELVSDFLPLLRNGHILMTTRLQATGTSAHRVEIEKMEPAEGALFLLRRVQLIAPHESLDHASYAQRSNALAIAQLLDGLPLALDQAAAYIEELDCGLAGYLERYRRYRAALLHRRGGLKPDHPLPVAATLSLSFNKVQQINPAAAELLQLCAFLYPDAIPEEIIAEGAADPELALSNVTAILLKLDTVIRELRQFSLVRRDPENQALMIHHLVQAVIRDEMSEDEQRAWAERAARAVNRVFPASEDFEMWQRCERYLPQVLACAEYIERWQIMSPEAARLLYQAGAYLERRAQYDQAEPLLKRALEIREQIGGTENLDVASSLEALAALYSAQGNYLQAEPLYQRALAIRERHLGAEHPDVAHSLNDLAELYHLQGKYVLAEPRYRRALEIRERMLGKEHPDVAESLNDLALLYTEQSKYNQAEPLYQRALAIRKRTLGVKNPLTASTMNNLAILYEKWGRYAQAELLHREALRRKEKILGPDHPEVANSLNNLAVLYCKWGKYIQAEQLHQRALAIREKVLGSEHLLVAHSLNNLASVYQAQGNYLQAEPLYQRALYIKEQALGTHNLEVAIGLHNLAGLYIFQQRDAEAEPLLLQSLALREELLGPDSLEVVFPLTQLAKLYRTQRNYLQAERLLRRTLAICEKALEPGHPYEATGLNGLALLSYDLEKYAQAESLFQQALAIRESKLGPKHPDVAEILHNLGRLYMVQGKFTQAEPLLRRALAIGRQTLGPQHPSVAAMSGDYADLLQKVNREATT